MVFNKSAKFESANTYFYDFIKEIRRNVSFNDLKKIYEEVSFMRSIAPLDGRIRRRSASVFFITVPLEGGLLVAIEFEPDGKGILQPVLAGFVND